VVLLGTIRLGLDINHLGRAGMLVLRRNCDDRLGSTPDLAFRALTSALTSSGNAVA
jgi:hypothetical protein